MFIERMNNFPKLRRSDISDLSLLRSLSKRMSGCFYLQYQPRILRAHNIQVRRAMKQSPKDAVVEVLVSG